MNWSKYQKNLFEAVATSGDSLVVEAVAGSGKTTSIVEAVRYVPLGQRVCFLAFNKAIADTLKQRINGRAYCATLHSLGLGAWKAYSGSQPAVDGRKSWDLLKEVVPQWDARKEMGGVVRLVGLAKQVGMAPGGVGRLRGRFVVGEGAGRSTNASYGPQNAGKGHSMALSDLPETVEGCDLNGLVDDSVQQWHDLAVEYDVPLDEFNVDVCRMVLRKSLEKAREVIDYDDMLWLPVITGAPFPRYDVVFVDEWQDTNAIQHEMVERMLGAQGRLIAVGDASQAIYRFRGSSSGCMRIARERFGCRPLPLSISYRCPVRVVEYVKQWVQVIEPAPEAGEGLVVEYPAEWPMKDFRSSDVVLCRLTRPLVSLAFRLIRSRIPCHILGREIGQGLVHLVEKSKLAPGSPISAFDRWLRVYHQEEAKRLRESRRSAALVGQLDDKIETLRVFMREATNVEMLIKSITNLFSTSSGLTLSTVHKAKGQEWDRVFVLDADELMPCEWSNDPTGEKNLMYVAATRAKSELYYIRSTEVL